VVVSGGKIARRAVADHQPEPEAELNFRVQDLQGKAVLTRWKGTGVGIDARSATLGTSEVVRT
jgi:hypothetical protein